MVFDNIEREYRARFFTAVEYAKEKHKNQKRVGGEDYITHPLGVCAILLSSNNCTISNLVVALLHDVLEDTDGTEEEMKMRTLITPKEIEAVVLLTKEKGYDMEDYISRITKNSIARIVKVADRVHNLQSSLIDDVTDKFRKKYVIETKQYFVDMAKGTGMEKMLEDALLKVEEKLLGII